MTEDELTSGFVRCDFVITVSVADEAARAKLRSLCEDEWEGTRVTDTTWEVRCSLSPDALELALAPLLEPGDRVACYYLSDTKRLFRVMLTG
jgi:hypothetical protein